MKILTKTELADKRMKALELLYNGTDKTTEQIIAWALLSNMIEEAE